MIARAAGVLAALAACSATGAQSRGIGAILAIEIRASNPQPTRPRARWTI